MTRSKPTLVISNPDENPARASLAELIASRASAQKRAFKARQAVERTGAAVAEAEARCDSAKEAVARARQQRAKRIRDAALAGSGEASSGGIADLVSQAAVAEEDLAAYREAFAQCQVEADEAEAIATDERAPLAAAVDAVIKSEPQFIGQVLAEAEHIQNELASRRVVLWWALRHGLLPAELIEAVDEFLRARTELPGSPGKPPRHPGEGRYVSDETYDWSQHEVVQQLEAFRNRLHGDAAATIPRLF